MFDKKSWSPSHNQFFPSSITNYFSLRLSYLMFQIVFFTLQMVKFLHISKQKHQVLSIVTEGLFFSHLQVNSPSPQPSFPTQCLKTSLYKFYDHSQPKRNSLMMSIPSENFATVFNTKMVFTLTTLCDLIWRNQGSKTILKGEGGQF